MRCQVNREMGISKVSATNKVRIGGGEYRSRIITFPDATGLRPTPDRVRETLFNWLGQTLYGRSCLDLFAGSGALGFEAASRGAEQVTMVEMNPQVFRALQENVGKLECTNISLRLQDGLKFALGAGAERYDVIFLDPPFQSDFLPKLLESLPQRLNEQGLVYVETGAEFIVSSPWQVIKSGRAGQVWYQLIGLAND
ncbi:MAG: 16S rRNA (guanine(966)-N(2))-methyltransferase RsmD [Gallionella sp.]|nr:16S rRNA (guanine(966)-N(2))-methyltransferase RsmD [Gallionella sp.]MDD4945904.1 16S rRNA (guanine(966)-N(2))-methyltransferase RsmD [Gallionella sp.]MDD5611440.1 16S rRNA (guanine(966)-N(2))-methyltransferase RsmD [Gallionella sp.]